MSDVSDFETVQYSYEQAKVLFLESHSRTDLSENCPACGSSQFSLWESATSKGTDFEWCPHCDYGRVY